MKSCLGMLFAILILVAVIGSVAGIWYLSGTAEFSHKNTPAPATAPPVER